MEPLNQKDRKKAFFNFLIFFSITAVLIIATVLFSVAVPFKQNEQLREQANLAEHEKDFTEAFLKKASIADHLLDSLNTKGVNVDLLDGKINEQLNDMNSLIDKDSLSNNSLYLNMIENLSDLRAAKKELRDAGGKDASLGDLKQQVADLKNELASAKSSVDACRTQLAIMANQK